ncbi:hypothetical protein EZMO1_0124 [Endozoicomonas montiporae CL-33]|uniref:Uncharacterized protein n=1 Tax=Endozoicomonas montiporae CL-33 TaxID=570277 RepID=A0A142B6M0_9GAMM|nr:hypothetical protein EZMO1_0124 [Endozoicomonas montiporae CL-33]
MYQLFETRGVSEKQAPEKNNVIDDIKMKTFESHAKKLPSDYCKADKTVSQQWCMKN